MSNPPDARMFIAEFGRKVELPEMAFDENGNCQLGFDDIVVNIEWHQAAGELTLRSALGDLPPTHDDDFYASLLEMNLASAMLTGGVIGLDRVAKKLVYIDRRPIRGMTQEDFERFIKASIDRVEAWQEIVAGRGSGFSPEMEIGAADPNGDFVIKV